MRLSTFAFIALAAFITLDTAAAKDKGIEALFDSDKCNSGGGCFYWDSRQCLWSNEDGMDPLLLPNADNITLRPVKTVEVRPGVTESVYEAPGYRVRLTSTDLGNCPKTPESQCTVYRAKVSIHVAGPKGKKVLRGVGYCGS